MEGLISMISYVDVTSVLQKCWDSAREEEVPTQFPGTPLDATRLSCWYEFWITQISHPPRRSSGLETLELVVDVHCYSRQSHKRQVFMMADHVQTILSQCVLSLSLEAGEARAAGVLRLREAVVRDLTRETIREAQLQLQHVVVSLPGTAERLAL